MAGTSPSNSKPTVQPLLVGASVAARLAGVSAATWWRLHAAGKTPAPVKLGGKTLWRVGELHDWIRGGCPSRAAWESLRPAQRPRR